MLPEYWSEKGRDNVCFISYEDMKKDLRSVILKVSSFLGKEQLVKDEAKMDALVTHLSFDKMKDNKAVNKAEFVQVTPELISAAPLDLSLEYTMSALCSGLFLDPFPVVFS